MRAEDAEAASTLPALKGSLRILLETEALIQGAGTGNPSRTLISSAELRDAMSHLLVRFLGGLAQTYGVTAGVLSPDANATISMMNRFEVYDFLKQVLDLEACAQQLGLDDALDRSLLDAIKGQLAIHLNDVLKAALNEAAAAHDYRSFTAAAADYLDLIAWRASGIFSDSVVPALSGANEFPNLPAAMDQVFREDPTLVGGDYLPQNITAEVSRLLRIFKQVPNAATFAAPSFERAYARMDEVLTRALGTLNATRNLPGFVDLLEAGIRHAALRDQFNILPASPALAWESNDRLGRLVERIAQVADPAQIEASGPEPENSWSEIHRAVLLLLQEGERLRALNQPALSGRSKLYLDQAVRLLDVERAIAAVLWRTRHAAAGSGAGAPVLEAETSSALDIVDVLLPGDLKIDRVAGSIRYNRESRQLEGAMSGQLRLPKFALSLTVNNASFSTGGEFDLNAYGSVVLPTADNPKARLSITRQHPLHVQFRAPRDLKVSGGARMEINGMTFEGYFALEDPFYAIGASAQGIRFDLANSLKVYLPALPADVVFEGPALKELHQYFRSMNATMEGTRSFPSESPASGLRLAEPLPALPPEESGRPPSYLPSFAASAVDPFEAWVNGLLVDARLNLTRVYTGVLDSVTNQLQQLSDYLRTSNPDTGSHRLIADLNKTIKSFQAVCKATQDTNNPAQQAQAQALTNTPAFQRSLAAADEALLPLLDSRDPKLAEQLPQVQEVMTGYISVIGCFRFYDTTPVYNAYVAFINRHNHLLLGNLHLNPDTGELPAAAEELTAFQNLSRDKLRAAITNISSYHHEVLFNGQDVGSPVLRTATGIIATRFREKTYERLLQIAPADPDLFFQKLDRLRHSLPDPGGCIPVPVDDLLALYEELHNLQKDLGMLNVLGGTLFDWPAGPVLQPYGPPAPFEGEREILNFTRAWNLAFLFANNHDARGAPLNNHSDNRVVRCVDVVKFVPAENRSRLVHLSCRIDLAALVGGDFMQELQFQRTNANPATIALIDAAAADLQLCLEVYVAQKRLRQPPAVKVLRDLIGLAAWAKHYAPARLPIIQADINHLTFNLVDSGTSFGSRLQSPAAPVDPAFWVTLSDYNDALIAAAELDLFNDAPAFKAALEAEANRVLRKEAEIANLLKSLLPETRPIDLKLPGDLVISKVFGDLTYRKDTGLLSATLGGRLEFPNSDAFFEVRNLTLDNQGDFSFQAGLATPLPFGGLRVTADTTVTGHGKPNTNPLLPPIPSEQQIALAGTGHLFVPNGQEYSASVSYDTTNKTLKFQTDGNNLNWTLSDHAVLFNAGFGLQFGGLGLDGIALPRAGEFSFHGQAGLFKKDGPPKNPNAPSPEDFHLVADVANAKFVFHDQNIDLLLNQGTLNLSSNFTANLCDPSSGNRPPTDRPAIEIKPDKPIALRFTLAPPVGTAPPLIASVRFSGALDLKDLGVKVPNINGLGAEICAGTLTFPEVEIANHALAVTEFPSIHINLGKLTVPLPPGQTSRLDLVNFNWSLNGFPSGRIQLATNLTVLDLGGFTFTMLAVSNAICPAGTALEVFPQTSPGSLPTFTLSGGARVAVPVNLLTEENGDEVTGISCGSLTVTPGQLPDFQLTALGIGGTFHLGRGGPVIRNAALSAQNIGNLFRSTPHAIDDPSNFTIQLAGALEIPQGPKFGLTGARFVFFDPARLPKFQIQSLSVDNRDFTLMQRLPARVQQATFSFRHPERELPDLFSPANIDLRISADINIPNAQKPYLTGRVDDLEIEFTPEGIPLLKSIDGFGMGVGGLKLPPIKELGGRLYVGGLRALKIDGTADLSKLFLVGRLGGSYNGYQVILQAAFNYTGPIGACLDVNAGSVGIPLGPTGFLLTGASGGFSFLNNNGDPCDFKTFFASDDDGNLLPTSKPGLPVPLPAMDWAGLQQIIDRFEAEEALFNSFPQPNLNALPRVALENERPQDESLAFGDTGIPCPGGCPPPTVNIFCQPHPDQTVETGFPGKVIVKFSSINEETLNAIGITRDFVRARVNDASLLAVDAAHLVRQQIESLTPPPVSPPLPAQTAAEIQNILRDTLNAAEAQLIVLIRTEIQGKAGDAIYDGIRSVVYAGLPCQDVTLQVSGTLSYNGISSFANVSGKGIISTAGAAGVVGTLNVVGIPLGEARVFVAGTDANGNPNPSICGRVGLEYGPLEIGEVKMAYDCPNCVNGMLQVFLDLTATLSRDLVTNIVSRVAPTSTWQTLNKDKLLAALTQQQRLGFLADLLSTPANLLPPQFPQRVFQVLASVWDALNPREIFCGQVQPKLFGLPLTPKAVAFSMIETKSEEGGSFQFSPSALLAGLWGALFIGDEATLSFDLQWPDPVKFILGGFSGPFISPESAAAYAKESLDYLLQNTAFGIDYTIAPLGLKMATAQARIIIPNLTEHPERFLPGDPRRWQRPENLNPPVQNLPSRQDLLIAAAATNLLGNAFLWKGTTNDLANIYPANSPVRTVLTGRNLARDYFPHGGVVGAGLITLPAALTETPPFADLDLIVNQQANPLDRLGAAARVIEDYILRVQTNGTLAFYLPAPNPPIFFGPDGQLLGQQQLDLIARTNTPQQLLDSIKSFDAGKIRVANLYPIDQVFIRGYLDGQLLGVPIVRADVLGIPPGNGGDAFFRITAFMPRASWLTNFVDQATLNFEIRQSPTNTIEKRFTNLLSQINLLRQTQPLPATPVLAAKIGEVIDSFNADMPKTSLRTVLQNVHFPPAISGLISLPSANGNLELLAYSPQFTNATGTNPVSIIQRHGGIALRGDLKFGNVVTIPNAELAVLPRDPLGELPPDLAGHFSLPSAILPGGINLQSVQLDFNSLVPALSLTGRIGSINLGPSMQLAPLDGRADLGATFSFQVSGAAGLTLALSPAKLVVPLLFGGDRTLLVHGATTNSPFTFSSDGPWNAQVSLADSRPFELRNGNEIYLSVNRSNLASMALSRTTNGVVSMSVVLAPRAEITVFPGSASQQIFNFNESATISIGSDGSFSLAGTLQRALTLSSSLNLPVAGFRPAARATVARSLDSRTGHYSTTLRLDGRFSGGILSQLGTGPLTAGGYLLFTPAGLSEFSGTVDVPFLGFDRFRLEPAGRFPSPFEANLSSAGLTFSKGTANLLFNNELLCSFSLSSSANQFTLPPSAPAPTDSISKEDLRRNFTLPQAGKFEFAVNPASFQLLGYHFGAVSFQFGRRNSLVGIWDFGGDLDLPNFSVRGFNTLRPVRFGGSMTSDGAIALEYRAPAANLALSNLQIGGVNLGFGEMHLTSSGLSAQGRVTLPGLAFTLNVSGAVAPAGDYSLTYQTTQPFYGFPIQSATYALAGAGSGPGSVSADLHLGFTGVNSTINNARLQGSIGTDGAIGLHLTSSPAITVAGYPLAAAALDLLRGPGANSAATLGASGNFALAGGNPRLTGTITPSGTAALVTMNYGPATLSIGGFTAAKGTLALSNSGLTASGSFALTLNGSGFSFGNVTFAGPVPAAGPFSLARSGGSIIIGGISLEKPSVVLLSGGGVSGSATLPYGRLNVPLTHLMISASAGLAFDDYNQTFDSGWNRFFDSPPPPAGGPNPEEGDVYARLQSKVTFSRNGNAFAATLGYTWAGWVVTLDCPPGQLCTPRRPPGNINDVPSPPRFSSTAAIGSDGSFTVNTSFGGLSSFPFTLW